MQYQLHLISSLRPNAYIIANVPSEKVARSLALKWGVYPKVVTSTDDTDDVVKIGVETAKEIMNLESDDIVAIIGGVPDEAHTNFLKIERI